MPVAADTTVTYEATDPRALPVVGALVVVRLIGSGDRGDEGTVVMGTTTTTTGGDGSFSLSLVPNSAYRQSGTYYEVDVLRGPIYSIVVPVSGVAVSLWDCRVDPTTLESVPVATPSLYLTRAELGAVSGVASLGADGILTLAQRPAGGGGVTDHGALTGLGDDDHAQYHNNTRGDARYYTQSQLDTSLAGKSSTGHTHVAANVTDFATAVDARIANVVGAAPAALDTLDELAQALGDDADFAGTVTTLLAAKAPTANPTFTGTVIGVTKGHVGLGNVDNTTDAGKPISTATQTALDAKLGTALVDDELRNLGMVAATGRPGMFGGSGGFSGQLVVARVLVRAGVAFTKLAVAIRSGGVFTPASGIPNKMGLWDDAGVLLQETADDDDMWLAAVMYVATLPAAVVAQAADRFVYVGMSTGGYAGAGQFVFGDANDGSAAFKTPIGSSQGLCMYANGGALANFNPATFGTKTTFRPFMGMVA